MSPIEGSRVSYIGPEADGLTMGDHADVLSAGPSASHVVFRTGSRINEIFFLDNHDLIQPTKVASSEWDDSFEGSIFTSSTVTAYEQGGVKRVVAVLQSEGHLACLDQIRGETLDFITSRLKQDTSIRSVVADLGDDDGEAVVLHTAKLLLKDLLGDL